MPPTPPRPPVPNLGPDTLNINGAVITLNKPTRQILEATKKKITIIDIWGNRPNRKCWIQYEAKMGGLYKDCVYEYWLEAWPPDPPTIIIDLS